MIGIVISSNLFYPISFAQKYMGTWSPSGLLGFFFWNEKFLFFEIETTKRPPSGFNLKKSFFFNIEKMKILIKHEI